MLSISWRRIFIIATRTLLITVAFVILFLLLFQHRLLYFPHHYSAAELDRARSKTTQVVYQTSQGRQVAFYVKPRVAGASPPRRLWIVFVGNASCALDWLDFAREHPEKRDGFLLVDYPGYGLCEGKPSPASISESAQKAVGGLADELHVSQEDLQSRIDLLGQSLGTGAALAFASEHPVERVILLAPYTSLRECARSVVGTPLCYLLRDNFDNRARLAEINAQPHLPRVEILHGTADRTISIGMSRKLAADFPKIVTLHEFPGSTHNTIVNDGEELTHRLMSAATPELR